MNILNITDSKHSFGCGCEGKNCKEPTIIDGMPTGGKIDPAPYPYNGTQIGNGYFTPDRKWHVGTSPNTPSYPFDGTKFPDGSSFDEKRQYHPATLPANCGEELDTKG